jgi:hypothetical protein
MAPEADEKARAIVAANGRLAQRAGYFKPRAVR